MTHLIRPHQSNGVAALPLAALAAALLSGCSGAPSAFPGGSALPASTAAAAGMAHVARQSPVESPDNICAHVWASNGTTVQGYKYNGITCPGTTIAGLAAATGLAIDLSGNLYVADADPTTPGVAVYNTVASQIGFLNAGTGEATYSDCVSRTGIVAAVNQGATPNVTFYTNFASLNPTGTATYPAPSAGDSLVPEWCAFDVFGDFFVDYNEFDAFGTLQKSSIGEIYRSLVNTNTTVTTQIVDSSGVTSYGSMFVARIGFNVRQLSVLDSTNTVQHYPISNAGVLTTTSSSPSVLAGIGGHTIDQIAAFKQPFAYAADTTGASIDMGRRDGSAPLGAFIGVATPVGVATYPTGQW